MKYAFFPGCTVLGRGRNYEMAAREVAKILGVELVDVDDFECCGFPLKSVSHETFSMMAARNILAAEDKGLNICTLCSACTSSLTEVNKHLTENFNEKTRIIGALKKQGIEYRLGSNIAVKHFMKVLYDDIGMEKIEKALKRKLPDLKLAAHYGCHYLKPSDIYNNPEDPENPYSLEDLIRLTGARPVDYPLKLRCCGAGILAINEDLAYALARPKLQDLSKNSIDAIILMCPFCSVMLDDNQRKIEQKSQETYNLPVLYYPQLLGLAMGVDEKALGLRMNRVSTKTLLEKIKGL
jgi:heterodisulfide reductase subunit B